MQPVNVYKILTICVHLPARALQWQAGLCPKKVHVLVFACPACPVAPADGTGVKFFEENSAANLTGVPLCLCGKYFLSILNGIIPISFQN